MRTSRLLSSISGLLVIILSTACYITSVQVPDPPAPDLLIEQKLLGGLRIAVVGQNRDAPPLAMQAFQKSDLFAAVTGAVSSNTDLVVTVNEAHVPYKCGLASIPVLLTLGLLPVTDADPLILDLSFSSPTSDTTFQLQSKLTIETKHGFFALFYRPSRKWKNHRSGDIQAGHFLLFRRLLLENASQLHKVARPAAA